MGTKCDCPCCVKFGPVGIDEGRLSKMEAERLDKFKEELKELDWEKLKLPEWVWNDNKDR